MKLFVKHYINIDTDKIEHTMTSDAPFEEDVGIEVEREDLQPTPKHRVEPEEFETTAFIRAGEMRLARRVNPGTGRLEENPNIPAHVKQKIQKKNK